MRRRVSRPRGAEILLQEFLGNEGIVGLKLLERRDDWMDFAGDRTNVTDSGTLTAISPYY